MKKMRCLIAGSLAVAALTLVSPACSAEDANETQGRIFATVDDVAISVEAFEGAMSAAIRQKYYHRRPPDDQVPALRAEVAERMVNQILLRKEAVRRGLQADDEAVQKRLAEYERRNAAQPHWKENRTQILPVLAQALRDQDVVAQIETAARVVAAPDEEALRAYYEKNPASFTEPERFRLSTIVLKVDPSSSGADWQQTVERARALRSEIEKGADFADLARLHSGDPSAHDGGDMGFRHRGMLPPAIESEIEQLAPGVLSEPIRLLEGIAIVRITERRGAQLRALDEVRRNVAELWAREQGEKQWRELLAGLRAKSQVMIQDSLKPIPLAAGTGGELQNGR